MSKRRYYFLLLVIAVVGIGVRVFHIPLTYGSDDTLYRIAASEFGAKHESGIERVYYSRIGLSATIWGWSRLFGTGLRSSAVLMFVLSLTTLILFATTCRALCGEIPALISATLLWLHPIAIQNDTMISSDPFALPVMLASLLCFVAYLNRQRVGYLLAAGFLAGAVVAMKEYYTLIAIPYAVCLLWSAETRGKKLFQLAFLACSMSAGLAVDPLLHYFDSGDWLAHIRPLLDYGQRQAQRGGVAPSLGIKEVARLIVGRAVYLECLLLDNGIAGGIVLICGWAYLLLNRRVSRLALPLAASVIFFIFLSFMPVGLRPLRFVEAGERYALVWMPFLAMGAGTAIAALLTSAADQTARRVAIVGLVLISIVNCTVPNTRIARGRVLECRALRKTMNSAPEVGVAQIVCPWNYKQNIPLEILLPGITLEYAAKPADALSGSDEYGDVSDALLNARETGFFVPARAIEQIALAVGEREAGLSKREIPDPRPILEAAGFRAREIRVPESSTKAWAAYAGVPIRGKLVGWFYVRPSADPQTNADQHAE